MRLTVPRTELDAWNQGVERSRREYQTRPNAACRVSNCLELTRTPGGVCQSCATTNGMTAARMRRLRGAA